MFIAVVGCTHGELDLIYSTLEKIEEENKIKVDILICCGDFQSVRYSVDNECLNVPSKYKKNQNDFVDYFIGKKKAKILTIFVGGNHEAMNVLKQLYYGGWVAPNIYYLGYSNVLNINNLRICSLSGIYKKYSYFKKYYESYPYTDITKVSAYHIRKYEIEKLKLLKNNVDIVVTHDWPNNIEKHGDVHDLLRRKFHFQSDVYNNTLGNPHTEILLNKLKPYFWFASHLHVKYSALYIHNDQKKYTRFLSLDKAQEHKHFIQILNISKKNDSMYLNFDHIPKVSLQEGDNQMDLQNDAQHNHDLNNGSNSKSNTYNNKDNNNNDNNNDNNNNNNNDDSINLDYDHEKALYELDRDMQLDQKKKNVDDNPHNNHNEDKQVDISSNVDEENNNISQHINLNKDEESLNDQNDNKDEQSSQDENDSDEKKKKKFYLCYDIEWLAILKANHHLISASCNKDYNLETLTYPTKEDFDFIENKLKEMDNKITIKGKDYYCVNGYNTPNYKNLQEQRQLFLKRFELEELSIYTESELNFFSEEMKTLEKMNADIHNEEEKNECTIEA
ncbi:RNA lariat debranching enzyme, putative [Plasmodium sp. gorilla clade G2]|uniref:RNA lariat debranching enzyme, putative n=1 Tax=Plasmodium sp. gorilla clade G2 TaxID=880535 RepID=UPI000D204B5C|nr:RNA lariat debranching enzyme, putative [Plasmodium sp. gorilla clade G2]SOV18076.1 RNA lariat debranching enzyme, putative [Plasmodium sp. gorilla clade G2]